MKDPAEILIVEHSPTQALRLRRTLEQGGFRVIAERNGAEALSLLEQAKPSLIITNIEMVGMSGYRLCQRIKSNERLAEIPVILLTSLSNPENFIEELECGADGRLTKPYEAESLLSRINSVLASKELPEAKETASPAPARQPEEHTLRILLAEDSRVNQLVAIRLLEKNGYSVVLAETGVEAVTAFASEPFDLILMDVEMPEMGGLAATALIRQQETATGDHVCILAMTAHSRKEDFERCIRAGMDGGLSKPLKIRELLKTLEDVTRCPC